MKFTIRDLLPFLAIITLTVGWGLDHWWQANRYQKFRIFHEKEVRSRETTIQALLGDYRNVAVPNSQTPAPNPPKP
jgi:hypothetical protein